MVGSVSSYFRSLRQDGLVDAREAKPRRQTLVFVCDCAIRASALAERSVEPENVVARDFVDVRLLVEQLPEFLIDQSGLVSGFHRAALLRVSYVRGSSLSQRLAVLFVDKRPARALGGVLRRSLAWAPLKLLSLGIRIRRAALEGYIFRLPVLVQANLIGGIGELDLLSRPPVRTPGGCARCPRRQLAAARIPKTLSRARESRDSGGNLTWGLSSDLPRMVSSTETWIERAGEVPANGIDVIGIARQRRHR